MKTLWEKFNPSEYVKDNYSVIHDEDKEIIRKLVNFCIELPDVDLALDVGVGPNLYSIMAMLPFAGQIECIDFSSANLAYLRKQVKKLDSNWLHFWNLFKSLSQKYDIDLEQNLRGKVIIKQGSIYELKENKYDLASMFFCAESITSKSEEFSGACNKFIDSVKPGGCLVAAFMENSKGYKIGNIEFSACPVDTKVIRRIFDPKTKNLLVTRIPLAKQPLRPGYTGMIFLTASI